MIQYEVDVREVLVDDYTGRQFDMGWTIIRNSDGLTRHVSGLTEGALNVLAESFEDLGGGREAAFRSATTTLQGMLNEELQQVEEDQASALLIAQQADLILEDGTQIDFKLAGETGPEEVELDSAVYLALAAATDQEAPADESVLYDALAEYDALADASPPTDVVERIGEYTGSKEQPSGFEVGQRVLILTDDEFMLMYDGATGVVKKVCPETSAFAYLVTINGNLHGRGPDAYLYASEVVALPAI